MIFEDLGLIVKTANGNYDIYPLAGSRMVFQYGDVLTIKKWQSLAYVILRQMTTIGKEDYVSTMMTAYQTLVFSQDYLHDNIHRLQGIYKFFTEDSFSQFKHC